MTDPAAIEKQVEYVLQQHLSLVAFRKSKMQELVWALLLIPIGVGLFLGYFISSSEIAQKAAWRNVLTLTAFLFILCPLIFALLFLPQPWQDYALSGFFMVLSVLFWMRIATESRRRRRAGSLLWNLGRLSTHKFMLIASAIFLITAIGSTFVFVSLATQGFPGDDRFPEYYVSQVIFYWSLAIYSFWIGVSRLELRENGIYSRLGLIKWAKIASYRWEGTKSQILTVWLKQRFPFFLARSWPIPVVHKPSIERILAHHLSGGTRGTRTYKN